MALPVPDADLQPDCNFTTGEFRSDEPPLAVQPPAVDTRLFGFNNDGEVSATEAAPVSISSGGGGSDDEAQSHEEEKEEAEENGEAQSHEEEKEEVEENGEAKSHEEEKEEAEENGEAQSHEEEKEESFGSSVVQMTERFTQNMAEADGEFVFGRGYVGGEDAGGDQNESSSSSSSSSSSACTGSKGAPEVDFGIGQVIMDAKEHFASGNVRVSFSPAEMFQKNCGVQACPAPSMVAERRRPDLKFTNASDETKGVSISLRFFASALVL
jgi:hypothetical protein